MYRYLVRLFCFIYYLALKLFCALPITGRPKRDKLSIVITGTFYSDNWLITHLKPLSLSKEVEVVKMVSVRAVPEMDKVVAVYPPRLLVKIFGRVPARLIYFSLVALRDRPDIIAGFHLLLNGMFSILLAKMLGRRSVYICGGGPREVEGGGYNTESKIFNKLKSPDMYIENILIKAVQNADLVISMGTSAQDYFGEKGVERSKIKIIPGGFDSGLFSPVDCKKEYDLILVGRLSKVKRVDLFLLSLERLKQVFNSVNAVVVGDGPDILQLKELAKELEIENSVHFVGWQNDIGEWLRRSKIFVLTSESEGLSQALIQAMMTGLPAIVSNVGDLSDLVVHERNGLLIDAQDPAGFAGAFNEVLSNEEIYSKYSQNAYSDAIKYEYSSVAKQWDDVFGNIT